MNDDNDFPGDRPFPSERAAAPKKQSQTITATANPQTLPASSSPPSETAEFFAMIERAARDPAVDVAKLKGLMELRADVEAMRAKREFSSAMTLAQTAMRPIAADASNPQTKSKYASYPALDKVIRPLYIAQGFSLSFDTGDGAPENCVRVLCYVEHTGGGCRTYHIDMPADGKGAKGGDVMTKTHATGSAVTYGMRYLLKMIFNIAVGGDDDDGNAAGETEKFLTQKQVDDLTTLIIDTGGDVKKFCIFAKVESLANIYASRYDAAVNAVNQAAAQRKAQKAKTKGAK